MTGDKILDAMAHIDADLIEAADAPPKKKRTKPHWLAAVAAVLILAIGLSLLALGNGTPSNTTDPVQIGSFPINTTQPTSTQIMLSRVNLLAAPKHPQMEACPNPENYSNSSAYQADYARWRTSQALQYDQPKGYADSLEDFFYTSMGQFLQGDENPTYSPVNVYLAMAMLAETTGGNSRQQILDLFGVDTIEQLREQASYVWNAHYSDDGQTSLLLANSLWLDGGYAFKQETADLLANHYYASSFSGDLGTKEANELLQNWLNINTGGLLNDQSQNVQLNPNTVFALASTVYFSAQWEVEFFEWKTADAVFHSPNQELTVPFMNHRFRPHRFYWADHFGAICLNLTGNNKMWLILPDEGITVAQVLASEDYLRMTLDPDSWENQKKYQINLSLPKFDVANQTDLIEGMRNLGVTDIFDSSLSNFTPMTDLRNLYVDQINHAARVAIDEKGCVAAAFTIGSNQLEWIPSGLETVDFVLDRPFLFIVSSRDNLPLFAGVVNMP